MSIFSRLAIQIKLIVWIGSRPALGERFCGEVGNPQEEEKLVYILQNHFTDVYFLCFYINERTSKMFNEMKPIHNTNSRWAFVIDSFSEKTVEIYWIKELQNVD